MNTAQYACRFVSFDGENFGYSGFGFANHPDELFEKALEAAQVWREELKAHIVIEFFEAGQPQSKAYCTVKNAWLEDNDSWF